MRWLCFLHASILAGFLQFATQDPRVSAAELNESQQLLVKQVNEASSPPVRVTLQGTLRNPGNKSLSRWNVLA